MLSVAIASFLFIVPIFLSRVPTLAILIVVNLLVARRAHLSGFVLFWLRATLVHTRRRVGANGLGGYMALTAAQNRVWDTVNPICRGSEVVGLGSCM